MTGTSVILQ